MLKHDPDAIDSMESQHQSTVDLRYDNVYKILLPTKRFADLKTGIRRNLTICKLTAIVDWLPILQNIVFC